MPINPTIPSVRVPPHISAIIDPRHNGNRRAGAARTSYVCECGDTYHEFRCPVIPAHNRFTWARRELELWRNGERPEGSQWYWSGSNGARGRSTLLWVLRCHKLAAFVAEHQHCASDTCDDSYLTAMLSLNDL